MSDLIKILYVDDEVGNLNYFKSAFRREFQVLVAGSGAEGLEVLQENPDIPVILTDQRMPKMTGVAFLMKSMEILPEAIRVLVTGFSDMETVINAINHGNIYSIRRGCFENTPYLDRIPIHCPTRPTWRRKLT